MCPPFAVVPLSVWIFAFWPVALFGALGLLAMVVTLRVMMQAPVRPQRAEVAGPARAPRDLTVMTGDIVTLPAGGPLDSLAA